MSAQAAGDGRGPLTLDDLRTSPGRRNKEAAIRAAFLAAGVISILISLLIVLSLVGRAFDFLRQIPLSSLFDIGWFPRRALFDIRTILVGTLLVTVIAMVVATPIGLGASIYLSEYASPKARRRLKPILETLAGIPSVVMGFFALTVISPNVVQPFCSAGVFNIAAAGIGVGILVVPLVATVAEDAMFAVPGSLREASYGLGAKTISTSLRVVCPAAVSGIVAALILGMSRAIGETLVVAMVAGGTGGSLFTTNVCGPGQTMTGAMAALATGSDQVRGSGAAYPSLFFVGLLLFLITFSLNILSERFVRRVRKDY